MGVDAVAPGAWCARRGEGAMVWAWGRSRRCSKMHTQVLLIRAAFGCKSAFFAVFYSFWSYGFGVSEGVGRRGRAAADGPIKMT
jgi:hypothetical protein